MPSSTKKINRRHPSWQLKLHEVVYESNTQAGKAFDIALLSLILLSVFIVMLDSVPDYHAQYGDFFYAVEWGLTIIFTFEYILRIFAIGRPVRYIFSFLGIIDLLAILPTYLSLFLPGAQSLIVVRAFRVLRVFRIFKLQHYISEMQFF